MNIYEKLLNIQTELKAPKGQYNSFGKYKYRSCEDILEAVKPICKKYNAVLILSDKIMVLGDSDPNIYEETYYDKDLKRENTKHFVCGGQRYYIEATAKLVDVETEESVENTAYAREEETKKGMDGSQITGTASSYARKYALNGLFNIDDTKDADTDEYKQQEENNEVINEKLLTSLNEAIQNAKIEDAVVELVLSGYGYSSTSEIKMKDYPSICQDFKKKKEAN